MKKAILSAVAIVLIGGTLVFANTSSNSKNEKKICPDRPGCICSDNGVCIAVKSETKTDNSNICPDRPGCICSK